MQEGGRSGQDRVGLLGEAYLLAHSQGGGTGQDEACLGCKQEVGLSKSRPPSGAGRRWDDEACQGCRHGVGLGKSRPPWDADRGGVGQE